jgi:hypothetical protein
LSRALAAICRLLCWSGDQALSNSLFARQFACAPHGFSFLSRRPVRRLLIEAPAAHLPEHTFALHLPLKDAKRLLDVIVSDEYLHALLLPRVSVDLQAASKNKPNARSA